MISRKQNLSGSIIVAVCVFFAGAAIALLQPALEAFADVSVQDKEVLEAVEKVAPTVEEIAKKIWELSEVSLLEIKSSAYLKDLLKNNGFTITSDKAAGVPTAFIAEYGKGGPKLGILLEYDALPDLGNEAVPKKEPRQDGVTSGHGCGHNLIGAGAMGAALAIKQLKAAVTASKNLALTGIDLLTDAEIRKQAKADFDKRTEGFTYKSPIPDMIKEPSGLPDDMRSHGTRSQLKATILKGEGDDSFGPHPHGHSHNY